MTLSEARAATDATLNRHDPDTYTVGDSEFRNERAAADDDIAFLRRQNEDAARCREELVRQLAERDKRIGEMGKVVSLAREIVCEVRDRNPTKIALVEALSTLTPKGEGR